MNAPKSILRERNARVSGTNYKFQRLREELRAAVSCGELSGRLPGERILARRFRANAKTLSKALTDLAAEGVLERIIGRGTFVKGTRATTDQCGRWLLLNNSSETSAAMVDAISAINPNTESIRDVAGVRPSFLGQFGAVIDLSSQTPEAFLRDLTVRNMPVVLVDREPGTLSLHAVLVDVALGGARLAREMLLLGHRKLLVVERDGSVVLGRAVRQLAARYTVDATVDTCAVEELPAMLEGTATGIICDSAGAASAACEAAKSAGIQIPDQISIAAVGCCARPFPVSGYYVAPADMAAAIAGVLRDAQITRPTVLWLNGEWIDAGTISSMGVTSPLGQSSSPVPMQLVI
jgi:DNA-binding transcriptional regulator YhcF (GntR family)